MIAIRAAVANRHRGVGCLRANMRGIGRRSLVRSMERHGRPVIIGMVKRKVVRSMVERIKQRAAVRPVRAVMGGLGTRIVGVS